MDGCLRSSIICITMHHHVQGNHFNLRHRHCVHARAQKQLYHPSGKVETSIVETVATVGVVLRIPKVYDI